MSTFANESEAEHLTGEQFDAVLRFLPMVESPEFTAGEWITKPGEMPWFVESDTVREFYKMLHHQRILIGFDYTSWLKETGFVEHPEKIQNTSVGDLRKLLTSIVRGDRFCEGLLGGEFRNGNIPAILRRLKELRGIVDKQKCRSDLSTGG